MPETISELKAKFGSYEAIPNAELYDSLCLPRTREDLLGLVTPYTEWVDKANNAEDRKENGQKVTKAEQQDFFNKKAAEALEEFKKHPFVASVRKRCKADLEWLACFFTWETNAEGEGRPIAENCITPESHGPILRLFVKKDDTKKIKDQDRRKIRMLLWPRGGQKSTIDVVDGVQWILNFPEIRLLYLTGDVDLAKGFVKETKGHFVRRRDNPTLMNLFFPEFCVEDNRLGNEYEFECPVWLARKILRKEPTVWATSVGSGMGGRHAEVVKADDAVYDGNTSTEEVCKNVSKKISITVRPGKVLRFYGYLDIVGTRYAESDYYGEVIEGDKKQGEVVTTSGKCWTLSENISSGLQILIGKAIVIKTEVAASLEKEGKEVTYINAGAEGCELLLPDTMAYSSLMGEYANNEESFEGQMNQNPRAPGRTTFDRPLLLRSTVNFSEAPFNGPVSQTWDFAGPFKAEAKGDRDYCTASAGIWNDKGTCFIQELIRKRFKPADLAKEVVAFAKKYHPFVVGIEDASGAQYLWEEIKREAVKTGDQHVIEVIQRIDWIVPKNHKGAKELRMAELHPWLVSGRLKFLNHCMATAGGMEILYNEFERCLRGRKLHNDIPDVISYQPRYAMRIMNMATKPEISSKAFLANPDKAQWNMLFENGDAFGRPGMGGPPLPIVTPEPEPNTEQQDMYAGVPSVLGNGW